MAPSFDRRVVPEGVLRFVRACQARVRCVLGGGAALSGVFLAHRLSHDIDLFCRDREDVRTLSQVLSDAASEVGGRVSLVQDAGDFVRAELKLGGEVLAVDLVLDTAKKLAAPLSVDGVEVESLEDLRAAKLTCLLSRSEPRDLVDVMFLDRAGFPPEADLPLALEKDAGVDPAVLGWLLGQFPVEPLPQMLLPLTADQLRAFREGLRERIRRVATAPPEGRLR
ncbi:MAG: nucleotidyl transferase AbiEii/AbiGii toxin family protein [Myxococcales bacterium]|nr:nucleotidyl transferase AbiEii/AbiGii toxin family protein [Myxococcales bacterium]